MDYNLLANLQYCKDIVDGMLSFILYSHIPSAIVTLVVSGYILYKTRTLAGRILFALAIVFSIWVGLDLSIWLGYGQASTLMTAWSVLGLLTDIMFVLVFYFVYVLVFEKNMPSWMFIGWFILLIPIFLFTPTHFNLTDFDIRDCVATENTMFTNYYYGIGALVFLLLPIVGYIGWKRRSSVNRAGIPMAIIGAELFLLAFFVTGVIAQYLVENNYISDFGLEQYGIIAMAVFMMFLGYVIVKYQEFNIKIIATQALVVASALLIGSLLFNASNIFNFYITLAAFTLFLISGTRLVGSVKFEIEAKEALKKANEMQADTASLITHQIRGVFTNTKSGLSNIIEGSYGPVPPELMTILDAMFKSQVVGVKTVETFLQAQKIESGSIQYDKKPLDLKAIVEQVSAEEKPNADSKGLQYEVQIEAGEYMVSGDQIYLTQVIANLIDNAIRYTEKGSIVVQLSKKADSILYSVKDSGIGIPDDDKEKMFTKYGHGKDSRKTNAASSGLGLYIVKGIVVGHGGKIWYETEVGKGTTFFVELPITQTESPKP